MSNGIIPDPDFEGWDGKYVDDRRDLPPTEYDLSAVAHYMKANNKTFFELTAEELNSFKLK